MDTISLISNSSKFNKIEDLYTNLGFIAELLKEDIFQICKAKNIYFSDFEASFKVALSQTKKTLFRKNLRGVKRFFNCSNLRNCLKWFRNRLINNMENANDLKHKFAFVAPSFTAYEDYNISKTYDIDKEIELENLLKMDKETIKQGLRKVWESGKFDEDFDFLDLKDLCYKYKIDLYDVIDKRELELPNIGSYELKSGKRQTFLMLDE